MKPFDSLSIRTVNVILISLMMLFSTALIVYLGKLELKHDLEEAVTEASQAADQVMDGQGQLVAGLERVAATISFFPAVTTHNKPDTEHLLSHLVSVTPGIANIMIADASGSVWASALPHTHPLSVAEMRNFKNAASTGTFSSGEYALDRIQRTPVLSFAYPVKNSAGMMSDAVLISIPVESFSGLYQARSSGPGAPSIVLVDHKGTLLFSSVTMNLVGNHDKADLFTRMSTGGERGAFEGIGNSGARRLFSYRALRLKHEATPYMYIRTGVVKEYVLKSSYQNISGIVAILSILLLISYALILYVSKKSIFDRLGLLQDAADKISRGDFSVRITGAVPNGELNTVATAFNKMAENLSDNSLELLAVAEKLQASEKKYRDLVDKASTLIVKIDDCGAITFINEYAEEFLGFTEEELLGRSIFGTITPEIESTGRDLKAIVSELIESPVNIRNTHENMRKNGERVWIAWEAHRLAAADGTGFEILAVGKDVTEQRRMEEILRLSEVRFRTFVENANDVVFALTPAGIFSYVSPQWKEAFGYEIAEVTGKSFTQFVHPDDVADCFSFLAELLQGEKRQRGIEYRVRHKNGSWILYTANGSPITEPDGTVSFVGIGRDISDQERVQNERLKAQKLESLTVLAAGIAHNFNNVLTGVIGYISYAKKHLEDYDKTAALLDAAEKSALRAAALARQLLTFSKGGTPLKTPVPVEDLVRESLTLFLRSGSIVWSVVGYASRAVHVDGGQINQAFNNIVLNSVHAMPKGGTLAVKIEDLSLGGDNPYLLKQGDYVKISFEDSGCGIEKKDLARVFDPYFTTRPEGTGLGLSTTHAIVARHGGYVHIASVLGQGTTVTVILPAFSDTTGTEIV